MPEYARKVGNDNLFPNEPGSSISYFSENVG